MTTKEFKLVEACKAAGITVGEQEGYLCRGGGFPINDLTVEKLEAAMSAAGYKPQDPNMFPSADGDYFVESADGDLVMAVFANWNASVGAYFLEFGGY